jgi:DNA-binding transcriptional LysR family regulator
MITDLKKLRHVVGVADAESFTRASGTLAVSQSALTKSVADVEHQLDVKLFQRLPRGVRLTEAGQLFVQRAQKILADTDDLMSGITKYRDLRAGRLRLGVAPAAFVTLAEDVLAGFAKVYPAIQIEVIASDLDQAARSLAGGQLDVVVGEVNFLGLWSELETLAVSKLNSFFIARADHPARTQAEVDIATLLSYPLVVPSDRLPTDAEVAQFYTAAGMSPRAPHYRCDGFSLVRKLVLNTNAIAPVVTYRQTTADMHSQFWVMENLIPLREYVLGLALPRSADQSPPVRAFVELFKGY